ncbi:putative bacteriophage coat protein [Yersinia pekkanenii]|uniref:Bacteriophage coat protein n=2 Tax=Yersinia pekkanenii TaxID=1288385 RepID=A0A0T9Q3X5_9GAMM|nr:putative bacteriophage coat protein [Yersinia pekkanenii]CRY68498.1 putative bacteriophage coat protein [Yersinia pekkanenii]
MINVGAAGVEWLDEGASEAYNINKAAQNVGAPIDQFSQVSGAMHIRGADKIAAIKSTERLYSNLNNMLWGQNVQGLAQLHKYGFDIISNENGTADVPATMAQIAEDFPQMAPKAQSILTNALNTDSNSIELLREGLQLKDLLAKSTLFGLTIDPELNARLAELESQTTELGAAWEGLKNKVSNFGYKILVTDNSLTNGIGGLTDLITRGPNNFSIMRSLGVINGNDSEKMNSAYNDDDFKRQLNWYEITMLNSGLMTDGFRKKYQDYNESKNAATVLYKAEDIGIISGLKPSQAELEPSTALFNLGLVPEVEAQTPTENTWSNNRVTDLNTPDPYSLWPLSSISAEGGVDTTAINISPIYTESAGGSNLSAIADVIATAMQNNRVQIELTLIDGRTGESSVIPAEGGGRITHAMQM